MSLTFTTITFQFSDGITVRFRPTDALSLWRCVVMDIAGNLEEWGALRRVKPDVTGAKVLRKEFLKQRNEMSAMPSKYYIKRCNECGKQDLYPFAKNSICRHCKSEGLDAGRVVHLDLTIPNIVTSTRQRALNNESIGDSASDSESTEEDKCQ